MTPPSKLLIPFFLLAATAGLIVPKLVDACWYHEPKSEDNYWLKHDELMTWASPILKKIRLNMLSYAAKHGGHFQRSSDFTMQDEWFQQMRLAARASMLSRISYYGRKLTAKSPGFCTLITISKYPELSEASIELDGTIFEDVNHGSAD